MKKILRRLISRFGYQLSKAGVDQAFVDQERLLRNTVGEAPVIFDVGAYTGQVALQYRSMFPAAEIYCFEPFPDTFSVLKNKVEQDPKINCYPIGVSNEAGRQTIQSNAHAGTNSLLKTDAAAKDNWGSGLLETLEQLEIEVATLDGIVERHGIERIDLLKMDVQGAEYLVIQGGKQSFAAGLVRYVYTEIIILPTYEGQLPFDQMLKLMDDNGFDLYGLYNLNKDRHGQLRQVDAIFRSKQY